MAVTIIKCVAQKTGMPVYLIPDTTNSTSDDHELMQRMLSLTKDRSINVTLVSPEYNVAKAKWIVSQMATLARAQTHSMLGALSSGIPALSFVYSIKAQEMNWDSFKHTDYCMEPTNLEAEAVTSRVIAMLDESAALRNDLAGRIPGVQRSALSAGMGLKHLIGVK